jgi:hypothetical protein
VSDVRSPLAMGLLVVGCAVGACKAPRSGPSLALAPEALAQRELETRRFHTSNELMLLRACLMILQDEGFQLDEMEADLGVIAATRPGTPMTSVSLVSRSAGREVPRVAVRVTFHGGSQAAPRSGSRLTSPTVYQEFFTRISRAVSLEAHTQ